MASQLHAALRHLSAIYTVGLAHARRGIREFMFSRGKSDFTRPCFGGGPSMHKNIGKYNDPVTSVFV